jgi:serine/threonine protein kinase
MLAGVSLPNGWTVTRPVGRSSTATGGYFSTGYIVENKDGRQGFLKAMDYSRAFAPGVDTAKMLNWMTSAHLFERQVCEKCSGHRLKRVVHAIESFTIQAVPNDNFSKVECLIFELADSDIRAHLDAQLAFDIAFVFRTLHNVAAGLEQLHRVDIAHQDLKPSNVLVFTKQTAAKISDLGRAWSRDHQAPHDNLSVAGDPGYAPPELLFEDVAAEVSKRRFGCDAYHLGSLIVFMFTRVHMTSLIVKHLDAGHRPGFWQGSYADVLPYVQAAFAEAVREFGEQVPEVYRGEVTEMVTQLCEPDPGKRGHPSSGRNHSGQFTLERFISALDLLTRKAEVRLLSGKV